MTKKPDGPATRLPAGNLIVDVPYFMHGRWAERAARQAGAFEPMVPS